MADSPYIFEATADNFQQRVLEASLDKPVLIDFWAEWCNPCKTLMPILAKLAEEYQGKFLLAKINTEEQQQLAGHFQIRSIPTVKLIFRGQMIDEFTGVLPEPEVRKFLDKHIPRESDGLLAQAEALLLKGETNAAGTLLKQARESDPDNPNVTISFARYLATLGKITEAEELLLALPPEERDKPEATALLARIQFERVTSESPPAEELEKRLKEDPNDSEARHLLASYKIMENDYEGALELLMILIQKDRGYGDNLAQKEILRIFDLLGGQGALVKQYRKRLFNMLH
jgi:putative thioredoxin